MTIPESSSPATTALAPALAAALTPFQPQGLEQAMRLADLLARSQLLPASLRGKPSDVLVTLITGHELGLSPMQSVRGMHVIEGKAVMSADLAVALILRRRDVCDFFRLVHSDDQVAEYQTRRHGSDPVKMTWSLEQAQKAGLAGKSTWKAHPAAMLRARCAAALARAVYPDLVLGVYDPDEASEFERPGRRPTPGPSPHARAERLIESATRPAEVDAEPGAPREGAQPPPTDAAAPAEPEAPQGHPATPVEPQQLPRARASRGAIALWSRLVNECGEDKVRAGELLDAACVTHFGGVVPSAEWSDADLVELERILFNLAF